MSKELFKILRLVAGYSSQYDYAEVLGIGQSAVSRMETGSLTISRKTEQKVLNLMNEKEVSDKTIKLLAEMLGNK
ncbi:helix-turn-helix domain-containing protein [Oceanobacillus picturae]|uniref:helix-turn-helix domain-containing protein n=1 Tax=Oceanobacillus picturae TaxID=171693 RepID=UPI000E6809EF|nr:helix-turn-helix transcriptional regulator [Oceanobacillus picturae]RIU93307.1 XRE family transcriptional regulator [Oceanobacillus picturae]